MDTTTDAVLTQTKILITAKEDVQTQDNICTLSLLHSSSRVL